MDTDELLYQRETVSQTPKRINGPQKEKNKQICGTWSDEFIQSKLILFKTNKQKRIHQEPLCKQESYSTL